MDQFSNPTTVQSPQSVPPRTSGLAIASFVMGLVSLIVCVLWPILALPAIICGIIALVKISGSGGTLQGKGYAITGIILPAVMLILLPIIAMLAAIAIPALAKARDVSQQMVTKTTLTTLHDAVNMFKMDTGRYPTQEEGLNALVHKPADVENWAPGGYLAKPYIPEDAWKHDFVYKMNPESGEPVIISYGADGKEGGQGNDADLRSTDE
jgi:general secretion pathway protein G